MTKTSLVPVIDLPFLAREINEAHREVIHHARSLLTEARRAGEALLAAKAKLPHGHFKEWVEAHCTVSYRQAMKYMAVAKVAPQGKFDPDLGINAFLDAHATPRKSVTATAPSFTKDEAEYVLKINARAEQGEGGERDVAARKLTKLAAEHGMSSADELVTKAKAMCPANDMALGEIKRHTANARADELRDEILKPFRTLGKDELLDVIFNLVRELSKGTHQ